MRFPGRSKTPVARTADDHMTLIEHLAELRMRLIRSVLGVLIGFTIVMAFYNRCLLYTSPSPRD